jgi:hypothetical protein
VGISFAERLWPSPGIWAVIAGMGLALGLVMLPLGPAPAVIAGFAAAGLLTGLATGPASRVVIEDGDFRAGRARIPLRLIASARAMDAEQFRAARGRQLDARAYLCIRGWLPRGVRIDLADPEDPTPYWLVASRHPDELSRSLSDAAEVARRAG